MKNILSLLVLLILTSGSYSSFAQKSKLYLEEGRTYSKGKIFLKKSLISIPAKQITLVNDTTISYTNTETGAHSTLNAYDGPVNYLKIKSGTRALEFGLYGAGVGLLSSAYALLQTELDYGSGSTSEFAVPFLVGFTAGGAAIGSLIGVFSSKYKNYYIKDRPVAYDMDIYPVVYSGQAIGLGMHITF